MVYKTKKNKLSFTYNHRNEIIQLLLNLLNTVKIYHWQTYSHSQHKSTDSFYDKLNELLDKYVEIYMGKYGRNILHSNTLTIQQYKNIKPFIQYIQHCKLKLIHVSLHKTLDVDLYNLRDEIVGEINRFLYTLSLQ